MINNGSVQVISTIIRHVFPSACEAEVVVLFINAKEGIILMKALQ